MKSQKGAKKQEKVFVLQWGGDNWNNLEKLNSQLGYGWTIHSVTPMGIASVFTEGSSQGNPIGYCSFHLVKE